MLATFPSAAPVERGYDSANVDWARALSATYALSSPHVFHTLFCSRRVSSLLLRHLIGVIGYGAFARAN